MSCINPRHDHELENNDEPGKCNGCGEPAHFDEGTGWYHHDDPLTLCDLVVPHDPGHTPCILPEEPQNVKS